TGRKLGEHKGYWFHTIGQGMGLGLSGGPWYVVKKNVHDNVIYVSRGYDTEKQYGREILLDEMHFISPAPWSEASDGYEITFKNRHTPQFVSGKIIKTGERSYKIESDEKIQGIAPGQFTAIYDREHRLCYGSGIITL
ncbi:MAG: tRNA 2-thiouridine(34) synthase MnmA, partial [Muribaculaceae bacterium]|nr:tRNA 2-thiouridine(34) synthase MnmA [Muribaculaceae bacterium]